MILGSKVASTRSVEETRQKAIWDFVASKETRFDLATINPLELLCPVMTMHRIYLV